MGLDIYAGTLTRYYAQNWKTAVEQWADENGYSFSKLSPDGDPLPLEKPDPAAVKADVEAWRDNIISALSQGSTACAPWTESNDAPYFTDKPDWDAFGALLLYAACRMDGAPVPRSVQKGWDYREHPVVKRFLEDGEHTGSLFIGAELWLPIEGMFSFICENPAGNQITVSTASVLFTELWKINALEWKADEGTILGWSETEGYPIQGQFENGELVNLGSETEYDTVSLAKFAFSILYQAALFSKENAVPILLDY